MVSTPPSRVSNPLVRKRHAFPTLSSGRKEESFIRFAKLGRTPPVGGEYASRSILAILQNNAQGRLPYIQWSRVNGSDCPIDSAHFS
jgi:hypothetical protein